MSELLKVDTSSLKNTLANLSNLFPKGSQSMPIGIHIRKGVMTIVCIQGCIYQADVMVDDTDFVADVTILYHDITPLMHKCVNVFFDITSTSLIMIGDNFEAEFVFGYSSVEVQKFNNILFKKIPNTQHLLMGLNSIIRMNLSKQYGKISPIHILGDVSLQKYGNTWVQVRTTGVPIDATIDYEHVKLLMKFMPLEVFTDFNNTLIFKNNYAILQIPCKKNFDKTLITDLMTDMSNCVTVDIENYIERVKNIAKLDSKQRCRIVIHDNGLSTSVNYENTNVRVSTGNISTEVLSVVELPIQLWLSFLNGLDSTRIQILTGGDKICLRTQYVIIVTHALI